MSDISENVLEHFGVKGMRWGVRKDGPAGVSSKVNRMASKDAKEHVLAKQYYGQGAGNRRKLIKGTVEQRSKSVPGYKKAFDFHVERQDVAKASSKAVSKRNRVDRTDRFKQRAGALARITTGQMGTQAAFVSAGVAGYAFMKTPQGQALVNRTVSTISTNAQRIFP